MKNTKKAAAGTGSGGKISTLKTAAVIAGITVVLVFICFFVYRFIFPEEFSQPVETSAAELSEEEKLADAFAGIEQSRKETVRDYPMEVYAEGIELSALYSGILYDGAPYGSGTYRFLGPDWEWTCIGTLKDGCISGGQVTDYPFIFELEDENSFSRYTGTLVNGMPKGEGEYEIVSGDDVIRLHGSYNSEKEFTGSVENYPLVFGYNDLVFEGRYTGELRADSPHGEGRFSAEGEYYYEYSGTWSGGNPVGPGTLSTNCASFSTGEDSGFIAIYRGGIENSRFSGEGEMIIGDEASGGYYYSGGWKEGAFSGEGKLVCFDPSGGGYTYEGSFSEGAYDGYGKLIFDDERVIKYIGNFEKGNYRPAVSELLSAFCSAGSGSFELSGQVKSFLSSHQEDLLAHKTDDLYFGSGFSYENYSQTGSNPDDRCFQTSFVLVQKTEYDSSSFGFPVSELLGYSGGGRSVYYGYYFGSLDAESGSIVLITAYPVGFSSYTDASGNIIPALRFAAFEAAGLN